MNRFLCRFALAAIVAAFGASSLPAQVPADLNDGYRIDRGDTLAVSVFGEPEFALRQRVDSSGELIVPLLGQVIVRNLTVREIEDMLEKRFIADEILKKPEVTVQVAEYRPRLFYVFGEVRSPGTKTFPGDRTQIPLIEAISMAGDFTDFARTNQVEIRRRNEETGEQTVRKVDVRSLITDNRDGQDYRLFEVRPGDIIFVPQRVL